MFDLVNMHQSDLEALRLEVSVELDRRRLIDSLGGASLNILHTLGGLLVSSHMPFGRRFHD